ncbi:MAG: DUF5684 domain-containing protein [Candidatus Saccharimonadales bacterium]
MIHLLFAAQDLLSGANYSPGDPTVTSSGPSAGSLIAIFLFYLVVYLVSAFMVGRVFKKAGKPSGAAFVPIYNTWVLLELGGVPGKNIFWIFLPIAGPIILLVKSIQALLEMGRRFGKSTTFSVFGLILFPLIGYIILAFDDSTYQFSPAFASAGPIPGSPMPPGPNGFAPQPQAQQFQPQPPVVPTVAAPQDPQVLAPQPPTVPQPPTPPQPPADMNQPPQPPVA